MSVTPIRKEPELTWKGRPIRLMGKKQLIAVIEEMQTAMVAAIETNSRTAAALHRARTNREEPLIITGVGNGPVL